MFEHGAMSRDELSEEFELHRFGLRHQSGKFLRRRASAVFPIETSNLKHTPVARCDGSNRVDGHSAIETGMLRCAVRAVFFAIERQKSSFAFSLRSRNGYSTAFKVAIDLS